MDPGGLLFTSLESITSTDTFFFFPFHPYSRLLSSLPLILFTVSFNNVRVLCLELVFLSGWGDGE